MSKPSNLLTDGDDVMSIWGKIKFALALLPHMIPDHGHNHPFEVYEHRQALRYEIVISELIQNSREYDDAK